jgi:carbon-monoxide dehydrogenase medium subunit
MKPPPFELARPESVEETVETLGRGDAKILAGGQSLVPLLNLRLARPSLIVDVNRIPGLDGVHADGELRLGALVRHNRLIASLEVQARAPLLVEAARLIGHHAIRNRGTLGGSLAHADPTAELPAATVALEARFRLRSAGGEREVPAGGFFLGPFLTGLGEDEMLVEAAIPPRPPGEGWAYQEVSPREGDFAIVAAAALTRVRAGALTGVRVVWAGAEGAPRVASELAEELEGLGLHGDELERACARAAARLRPVEDLRVPAAYRRAALATLTARALRQAAGRAA